MKKKQNLRKRFDFLLVKIVAAAVGWVFSFMADSLALAEPIENYCISRVGPKKEITPSPKADSLRVDFKVENKRFHISKDVEGYLYLFDADNNHVSKIMPGHRLEEIFLTKTGWLLINGLDANYLAKVDMTTVPPSISSHKKLSDLKSGSCSYFGDFWDRCWEASGYYSSTLDRFFVTGDKMSLLGFSSPTTIEIIDGKSKPFPLKKAYGRIYEAPKLKGILLYDASNRLFFYDGHTAFYVMDNLLNKNIGPKKFKYYVQETSVGHRFLITNIAFWKLKEKPFIFELMAGLELRPVSASIFDKVEWIYFFDFPQDKRVFGLIKSGIVAEIDNKMIKVVSVKKPYYLQHDADKTWQNSDGSIAFNVRNRTNKELSKYFLTHNTLGNNCHMPLNADKPIVLDPESHVGNGVSQ